MKKLATLLADAAGIIFIIGTAGLFYFGREVLPRLAN